MSYDNYGQVATNREILRQEKAERESASRQPDKLEDLSEQVDRLRRELAALRSRPAFDAAGFGAAFGKELVTAVRGYCDPVFDELHARIDGLEERVGVIDKSKAGKARVRLPAVTRSMDGKELQ
jgi:hypothetical protein